MATARKLLARGLQHDPKNPSFYILAASIETHDNQPDQAEAVLRRGIEAIPANGQLAFLLTDLLIGRNKLEGPETVPGLD